MKKKILMGAAAAALASTTFVMGSPGTSSAGTPILVNTFALVTPTTVLAGGEAVTKPAQALVLVVAESSGDAFAGAIVNTYKPLVATITINPPG